MKVIIEGEFRIDGGIATKEEIENLLLESAVPTSIFVSEGWIREEENNSFTLIFDDGWSMEIKE